MVRDDCEIGAKLTRRRLLTSAWLTVAAITAGCQATVQRLEVTQSGTPKFEQFRAEYQFEQPDRLLGRHFADWNSADASEVRTVSAEASWSEARLKIECPHPDGDNTRALLTLTLNERRSVTTFDRQEVRQLTVSRSQVELLISDLAREGYFDELPGEAGNAQLSVQIDRGKISRDWYNDARLLDLAHQTLSDGKSKLR